MPRFKWCSKQKSSYAKQPHSLDQGYTQPNGKYAKRQASKLCRRMRKAGETNSRACKISSSVMEWN